MVDRVDDTAILQRLDALPGSDRAAGRTNPFAIAQCSGDLVTADEVEFCAPDKFPSGFRCPKCSGLMRYYVSKSGTPYFAHASSRGNCPAGHETPAHLCIKRGLHSVGFDCEISDDLSGYRWDAKHQASGVVAEVVCSGLKRYRPKISHISSSGMTCWWILDSASPGLCSRWGSEQICYSAFLESGTVVLKNLFKDKVFDVFSAVAEGCLFAFYLGLIWKSVGRDEWQLLDASHALSQAAVAEDGIKHLMVKMHAMNSHIVTENKRRSVDRKTWFDRKFRFRGPFSMTWGGDRDYVVEMVANLIRDLEEAQVTIARDRNRSPSGVPKDPVHASAEDVIRRINERHSASADEIAALRKIADRSRVTRQIQASEISDAQPSPLVLDANERRQLSNHRTITSGRWHGRNVRDMSREQKKKLEAANRQLLEIAASRRSEGMPSYYLGNY